MILVNSDKPTILLANAIFQGRVHLAKDLLRQNVNLKASDAMNRTLLHLSAVCCQQEIGELLINHGANVNALTTGLQTPLHYSARNGLLHLTECLITNGAMLDPLDIQNESPLSYAKKHYHDAIVTLINHAYYVQKVGEIKRRS